jgi:hypothetical protein
MQRMKFEMVRESKIAKRLPGRNSEENCQIQHSNVALILD